MYKTAIILLLVILSACSTKDGTVDKNKNEEKAIVDLEQIRERGKIVVLTDYNSTNYFIYKGRPMGFQYELLKEFANFSGLELEINVNNDLDEKINELVSQKADLIAINMTITKERRELVHFTVPHSQTRQVLVQRKPDKWRQIGGKKMEEKLIRNPLELAGDHVKIYVQRNSAYISRLKNLSDEIGDTIRFIEVPEDAEKLISHVARGDIDYTVCDENIARVNSTYYANIDIETAVSFPQNLAWAVRKESGQLLEYINDWMVNFKKTKKYKILYRKYFIDGNLNNIRKSDYFTIRTGKVSAFDNYIKRYSEDIGWDWKLLASLIYQESRFNPHVKSFAGAFGIMQLMPSTAKQFGVDSLSSPVKHIKAGVQFLKWLDKRFEKEIANEEERIKFVLASYNVGLGHVEDARRLAQKNGKDPNIWKDHVEYYLLQKSNPEYYTDSVVKHGYCRGLETYNYVNDILDRYKHYANLITE